VLGRDEKLRRAYDRSIKSRQYFDVIEEVGSEVIMPLAFDVAVPLINMTARAIGE
jgi:hypothetical protein